MTLKDVKEFMKAMGVTNTVAVAAPSKPITLASLREAKKELDDILYVGAFCASVDEFDALTKRGFKLDLITFKWGKRHGY